MAIKYEEEISNIKKICEELKNQNIQYGKMYNESIQKEKEKIKEIATLTQYKLQYDQMQKDFHRQQQLIKQLSDKLGQYENEIKTGKDEIRKLQTETRSATEVAKGKNIESQTKNIIYNQELDKFKKEILELKQMQSVQSKEFTEKENKSIGELAKYQSDLQQALSRIKENDTKILELQQSINSKEQERLNYIEELNKTKKECDTIIIASKAKEQEFTSKTSLLQQSINAMIQKPDEDIVKTTQTLKIKELLIEEKDKALLEKESQLTTLNSTLQAKAAEIIQLASKVSELQSLVDSMTMTKAQNTTKLDELNTTINENTQKLIIFEKEKISYKEAIGKLEKELENLNQKLAQLSQQLTVKDEECINLKLHLESNLKMTVSTSSNALPTTNISPNGNLPSLNAVEHPNGKLPQLPSLNRNNILPPNGILPALPSLNDVSPPNGMLPSLPSLNAVAPPNGMLPSLNAVAPPNGMLPSLPSLNDVPPPNGMLPSLPSLNAVAPPNGMLPSLNAVAPPNGMLPSLPSLNDVPPPNGMLPSLPSLNAVAPPNGMLPSLNAVAPPNGMLPSLPSLNSVPPPNGMLPSLPSLNAVAPPNGMLPSLNAVAPPNGMLPSLPSLNDVQLPNGMLPSLPSLNAVAPPNGMLPSLNAVAPPNGMLPSLPSLNSVPPPNGMLPSLNVVTPPNGMLPSLPSLSLAPPNGSLPSLPSLNEVAPPNGSLPQLPSLGISPPTGMLPSLGLISPPTNGLPSLGGMPSLGSPILLPPVQSFSFGMFGNASVKPSKPVYKPSKKLKGLTWMRVVVAPKGHPLYKKSYWEDIQEVELNKEEVENMFEEEAVKPSISSQIAPQKQEKEKVFDVSRIQNMSIVINKLPPMAQFKEMLESFSEEGISKEQLESLLKIWITKDEKEMLLSRHAASPDSKWDRCENFFLAILQMETVKQRIEIWKFKLYTIDFFPFIEGALKSIEKALKLIYSNDLLKQIYGIILAFGNILNGDTSKGQADGFKIDVFTKLNNLKDKKGTPAIDYISKVFYDKHPTANLQVEFEPLFKSSRYDLTEMEGQGKKFILQINSCINNIESLKKIIKEDDPFPKVIAPFIDKIEAKKTELDGCINRSKECYATILDNLDIPKDDERAKNTSDLFKFFGAFINGVIKYKLDSEKEREKSSRNKAIKPFGKAPLRMNNSVS